MKTYTYNGIEYKSESQLRKAIWYKERKALPKVSSVEEWAKYGVVYKEIIQDLTPPVPLHPEKVVARRKIEELKKKLASYDYIGVKIATGCATVEDYAEQIAECQVIREEVNELEDILNEQ